MTVFVEKQEHSLSITRLLLYTALTFAVLDASRIPVKNSSVYMADTTKLNKLILSKSQPHYLTGFYCKQKANCEWTIILAIETAGAIS